MAGLPKINLTVTGNIARPGLNTDGISGFVFYNDNIADLTTFSAVDNRVINFNKLSDIEATGITSDSTNFAKEHYILSEFFRLGGTEVYVGIFDEPATTYDYAELNQLKNKSQGDIKVYGVFANIAFDGAELNKINTILSGFDDNKKSAIAYYAADFSTISLSDLENIRELSIDAPFVGAVLGQDTENYPATVSGSLGSIPNLGAVMGATAIAPVNGNILNVGNYNYTDGTNMENVGFYLSGSMINSEDVAEIDLDTVNDKGYVFWRYFPNYAGTYLSNDNNANDITDTFNSMHIMRTRNKVVREVDAAVTPLIGSTLNLNADGTLSSISASTFENIVSTVLLGMQRNGEISQYDVLIDRNNNVASTKTVIIDVSIVPTESADFININLEFTSTL